MARFGRESLLLAERRETSPALGIYIDEAEFVETMVRNGTSEARIRETLLARFRTRG